MRRHFGFHDVSKRDGSGDWEERMRTVKEQRWRGRQEARLTQCRTEKGVTSSCAYHQQHFRSRSFPSSILFQ